MDNVGSDPNVESESRAVQSFPINVEEEEVSDVIDNCTNQDTVQGCDAKSSSLNEEQSPTPLVPEPSHMNITAPQMPTSDPDSPTPSPQKDTEYISQMNPKPSSTHQQDSLNVSSSDDPFPPNIQGAGNGDTAIASSSSDTQSSSSSLQLNYDLELLQKPTPHSTSDLAYLEPLLELQMKLIEDSTTTSEESDPLTISSEEECPKAGTSHDDCAPEDPVPEDPAPEDPALEDPAAEVEQDSGQTIIDPQEFIRRLAAFLKDYSKPKDDKDSV